VCACHGTAATSGKYLNLKKVVQAVGHKKSQKERENRWGSEERREEEKQRGVKNLL